MDIVLLSKSLSDLSEAKIKDKDKKCFILFAFHLENLFHSFSIFCLAFLPTHQ